MKDVNEVVGENEAIDGLLSERLSRKCLLTSEIEPYVKADAAKQLSI